MIGKELSGYKIVDELAIGGMGIVYRGESIPEGTPAAVKFLRQDLQQKREDIGRFIREAMIYKRLRHPNLIQFYAFGFEHGVGFYLVTELLDGFDLEEILEDYPPGNPMDLQRALDIALQICAGLATAHDAGILHRDLKPANIFLTSQEEGSEVVKIFDFGIGKLEEDKDSKLTAVGTAIGTPLYMAPEQIRGSSEQGPGVDIYSFGVILFQLLTGKCPFEGSSPMQILAAHLQQEPPLIRTFMRSLSSSPLEQLVRDLLEKEWRDRPSSFEKIKNRLWDITQSSELQIEKTHQDLPAFDSTSEGFSGEIASHLQQEFHSSVHQENPVAVLLLNTEDGEEEIAWLLPGERLMIGSDPKVDVRIRNRELEPIHAEMYCAPDRWITLQNFKHSIVRVNGASIMSMMLNSGDCITLGNAELRLHFFDT